MKYIFLFGFFFFVGHTTFAQKELFVQADALYANKKIKESIYAYEKALEADSEQPLAMGRLAQCYYLTRNYEKAEKWYAQCVEYNGMQNFIFEYAQLLKTIGKLDLASKWFSIYSKKDALKGNHYASSIEFVKKYIEEKPADVIHPQHINSKNADFAPLITQGKLLFASSKPVSMEKEGRISWTGPQFNQYYQTEVLLDKKNVGFPMALRSVLGKDINDAPMSYSRKGDWVAVTSNNFTDGIRQVEGSGLLMDLYVYKTKSLGEWDQDSEQFLPFNAGINDQNPYSSGHPFLAAEGTILYFSSNRPGGFGGFDLYYSQKNHKGWSDPINLGPQINSPGNEMTPFIDELGKLYFSSDWHHGFGGLDIFYAEKKGNQWTLPVNLGKSVNSSYDDSYYCSDYRTGLFVFVSDRKGSIGNEDIYIGFQDPKTIVSPKPVVDVQSLPIKKIKLGDFFSVQLLGTDINKALEDLQESYVWLQSLKNQSQFKIQIDVHTDARGSQAGNLNLSNQQASTVAQWFINRGLEASRIKYQGLGEKYTLNGCVDFVNCSESEHQINYRAVVYVCQDQGNSFQFPYKETAIVDANQIREEIVINQMNPNRSEPEKIVAKVADSPQPLLNRNVKDSSSRQNLVVKTDTKVEVKTPNISETKVESKSDSAKSNEKTLVDPKIVSSISTYKLNDFIQVAAVRFKTNSTALDESSPGIKEIISLLKNQKDLVLEIGAHTDSKGSTTYNQEISLKRAEAIKDYLASQGIKEERLIAKGYGESQVKNKCKDGVNCTDAEHALNRRIEFKVIGLTQYKVGDYVKGSELVFEVNKDVIDQKKSKGLKELISILKENGISVEIRAHTDAKGSSSYNLEISEKRAKNVYDYLISNGVNKHKLKYKGYGETLPLNRCKDGVNCSDAEHAVNRRIEFKVIGLI